jgi:hypothetical protein
MVFVEKKYSRDTQKDGRNAQTRAISGFWGVVGF